uniref:Ig-like domain-containing protein n=1 Tax=Equus asinus asinus TaxID=83772 RepID=A0A8C4LTU7_EQUAS
MGTGTLCCVVLCLLGVEPTDAGVTQEPRHQVTKVGQTVTLRCEPISSHTALFWYRQTLLQGLEVLISFGNQSPMDETGMPKDWFSAEMPDRSFSTLKIQCTEPKDSAMNLCASSLSTALKSHPLSMQKSWLPLLAPATSPCSSLSRLLPYQHKDLSLVFYCPQGR